MDAALLSMAVLALPGFVTPPSDLPTDLEVAEAAARWIRSTTIETPAGVTWPVAPFAPDAPETAVSTPDTSLYAGAPGVVLFLLELGRATGDDTWTDLAIRGADELAAASAEPTLGLWTGVGGQAFALLHAHECTGIAAYEDAARRRLERIVAHPDATWGPVTDVIGGTAGIGLALLDAAERLDEPRFVQRAQRAADELLAHADRTFDDDGQARLDWPMSPDFPRRMPNFSHGTAGISFFLARLHETVVRRDINADTRYLDAAIAGARTLDGIALRDHDGYAVYHHLPDGRDLFYLSWCHGPAGTSSLFLELERVTDNARWHTRVDGAVRTLRAAGIPERRTPGFWDNVGRCCGSAGVGEFLLHLTDRPGVGLDAEGWLDRLRNNTISRATPRGGGLCWVHCEHRVRPELRLAQTGLMQGAAGIGLWFLRLDARHEGRSWTLRFPDEPG